MTEAMSQDTTSWKIQIRLDKKHKTLARASKACTPQIPIVSITLKLGEDPFDQCKNMNEIQSRFKRDIAAVNIHIYYLENKLTIVKGYKQRGKCLKTNGTIDNK